MRTSISFLDLLREAAQLSLRSRHILAFALPFGLLAWGSTWGSRRLSAVLPESADNLATLWQGLAQSGDDLLGLGSALLCLGILRALCRGPLFLVGESRVVPKTAAESSPLPSRKALSSSMFVSLLFELAYWVAIALLAVIIVIPVFLAVRYNQSAAQTIAELGIILLLTLSIALFYLKEFALLYRLLAHIRPMLALELGLKLFKKHLSWSLLFGLFLAGLSLLFTFFANLAIIASDLVVLEAVRGPIVPLATVVILGCGTVIEEMLRLLFFHALAAAPKQPNVRMKKLLEEKNPGNVPSV